MSYKSEIIIRDASRFYLSHRNNAGALAIEQDKSDPDPIGLDKAQMRYDRNTSGSGDFIESHWDVIIQDALADAACNGVQINYPQ